MDSIPDQFRATIGPWSNGFPTSISNSVPDHKGHRVPGPSRHVPCMTLRATTVWAWGQAALRQGASAITASPHLLKPRSEM